MRLASISSSLLDRILARPVLDEKGMVLLGEGSKLTDRLIQRLRDLGVYTVYIHDDRTDDIVINDSLSDKTRQEALSVVQKSMNQMLDINQTSKRLSRPQMGKEFSAVLQNILQEIQSNPNHFVHLSSIFSLDGYLYHHSLNVTVLATVLGISKGFNAKQLIELGIGALLHDVGMTKVPSDLLNKTVPFESVDFETMKKHTEWGYEYLKDQDGVSLLSAHVALQHHERINGSGYPRGISGDEIHEYAKIVAICDVFEAMTTHRRHRKAYLPHEALEYLMAGSGTLFDLELVKIFAKNIAVYPIGLSVKLNNGQAGVVSSLNPEYPQRPIVRLLTTAQGLQMATPVDADLTEHLTLMITGIAEI